MRLGIALGLVALCSHSACAQWDPETPLSSASGDVWGEGIATSGSSVYAVFGSGEVRFRSSNDEGATWSSSTLLDNGTLHLTDPMVADGNDVWVIEMKNLQNRMDWWCVREVGDLYLLHSGDRGVTWDSPRRLTTGAMAFRYSIAYAVDRLHIVWMDYRTAAWDTYYLRSPDRSSPRRKVNTGIASISRCGTCSAIPRARRRIGNRTTTFTTCHAPSSTWTSVVSGRCSMPVSGVFFRTRSVARGLV